MITGGLLTHSYGQDTSTVNQLLFPTNLFQDLPEENWLAATNFLNQDVDYLKNKIPRDTETELERETFATTRLT